MHMMATTVCTLLMFFAIANLNILDYGEARKLGDVSEGGLFVFGDSYADTGNHNPSDATLNTPWKKPYGMNWPGYPSGRYSNGHVFTDYFVTYVGMKRPITYRIFTSSNTKNKKLSKGVGINFAFGGSGVFPTFGSAFPTISMQIDQLQAFIDDGRVPKSHVTGTSAIALLVVAGNDYTVYSNNSSKTQSGEEFVSSVIKEMGNCLEKLYKVGFRKLAVTKIEPFGCFPRQINLNNNTICNETVNYSSSLHNQLLTSEITSLQQKLHDAKFSTFDLENAFLYALKDGKLKRESCCQGSCGEEDSNGKPLYTVCSSPNDVFYWDQFHPTNKGWSIVFKFLSNSTI